ncbi:fimbrial biogenesis chaperone [Klebsiella variicola]
MMSTRYLITALCFFAINTYAGIMPSQSRIVYTVTDKDKSLMLANTNDYPVIVQTWIDRGEGTPDSHNVPFVSIPPVFRLDPSGIKGVRIIYNKAKLPEDKESLFWFNIYEIPPERKNMHPDNSVRVTMNTQIKLFYRPASINVTSDEAIENVHCRRQDIGYITCNNPTPVHISVIDVRVSHDGKVFDKVTGTELMLKPFGQTVYHFRQTGEPLNILIQYIDDAGNKSEHTLLLNS